MQTAILQYNAGNIRSVQIALERLGVQAVVTDDPDILRTAGRVIFPGVGEASSAMQHLQERGLDQVIRELRQPVLGICLGMQLLCAHSEENNTPCLGIFESTRVKRFAGDAGLKVPQIGWNTITNHEGPLFRGVSESAYCYFVHSYYAEVGKATTAVTDYGGKYSAALQRDNFFGVQFHPEKSATVGEQILKNFLAC